MNQRKALSARLLALAFLLGSFKGYLALWQDGGSDPVRIYPVAVASLPKEKQELLEKGIEARNPDQLRRLLENFLS